MNGRREAWAHPSLHRSRCYSLLLQWPRSIRVKDSDGRANRIRKCTQAWHMHAYLACHWRVRPARLPSVRKPSGLVLHSMRSLAAGWCAVRAAGSPFMSVSVPEWIVLGLLPSLVRLLHWCSGGIPFGSHLVAGMFVCFMCCLPQRWSPCSKLRAPRQLCRWARGAVASACKTYVRAEGFEPSTSG